MVTQREVLEEALERTMTQKRCFSEGMRNIVPKAGYEKAFYLEQEKENVIRQMMRKLEER